MKTIISKRGDFNRLLEVMRCLRARGGCPWDRQQRLGDLVTYLLEETHETLEAMREENYGKLKEELGDLLYQVVFVAHLADEKGKFNMTDVIDGICNKLVHRHPHVFGNVRVADTREVLRNWEGIKMREKADGPGASLLDGVPGKLPALLKAFRLSSKAARVGFDWENAAGVFRKIAEETKEFVAALKTLALGSRQGSGPARGARKAVRNELGDILFVICNLARKLGVDPEDALQRTNAKFIRRFKHIERTLHKRGLRCTDVGLADMDRLWQEAKGREFPM